MDVRQRLNELDLSKYDCEYCDVRIEETAKTDIVFENYTLLSSLPKTSVGAFIRVYDHGMWVYAATTALDALDTAIKKLVNEVKTLPGSTEARATTATTALPYNTQAYDADVLRYVETDVSGVPLTKKMQLCQTAFPVLKAFPLLKKPVVRYTDTHRVKSFQSSTGIRYRYDFNQCGLRIDYALIEGDLRVDDHVRFYGDRFDALINIETHTEQEIKESHRFLHAPTVEAGRYQVVLDSEVVGVFAHESFGHKSEADFMLGDEKAQAHWKIGSTVGSDVLTLVDEGQQIGSSGYCPFDDEGFPSQRTTLIEKGILKGRLHSQHTAAVFNEAPTGNARAINFEYEPLVRMTNTVVEAGEESVESLLAPIKEGLFIKDYRHGSGLSTFTIAPLKSYWIRDGKIAEPVNIAVLSGSVFETLGLIDGVSNRVTLHSSAFGGCGKMEQWPLSVGFGGAMIRIREMMVS